MSFQCEGRVCLGCSDCERVSKRDLRRIIVDERKRHVRELAGELKAAREPLERRIAELIPLLRDCETYVRVGLDYESSEPEARDVLTRLAAALQGERKAGGR